MSDNSCRATLFSEIEENIHLYHIEIIAKCFIRVLHVLNVSSIYCTCKRSQISACLNGEDTLWPSCQSKLCSTTLRKKTFANFNTSIFLNTTQAFNKFILRFLLKLEVFSGVVSARFPDA